MKSLSRVAVAAKQTANVRQAGVVAVMEVVKKFAIAQPVLV